VFAGNTCGYGLHGRLGLGDEQPRRRLTQVPQAVFAGSRVIMVSCGTWYTIAVKERVDMRWLNNRRRGKKGRGAEAGRGGEGKQLRQS
jgi:hypothetical protein